MLLSTRLALLVPVATAAIAGKNRILSPRDGVTPSFDYDPATTKYCSYWWDTYDLTISCQEVPATAGITSEQWKRWVSSGMCKLPTTC